jgi:hypothetical protein
MKDFKALLDLVFDPTDDVCVSNAQWAYHSIPQSLALSGEVTLVSNNSKVSVQKVKTSELTLLSVNAIKGFRNDSNVTKYRTFLWECDIGTLQQQLNYAKDLELPYSAAIFSGNKSVHFLTVLDEAIDAKTYRYIYRWVLSIGTLFDKNCKNPSRGVRIPGNIRPDTDREQKLISLGSRVKLEDFYAWLSKYDHLSPKEQKRENTLTNGKDYGKLSRWAVRQFEKGIDFSKGRNQTWYALACDLVKSGFCQEEAVCILGQYYQEEHDFQEKEFLSCIDHAYQYMRDKE